MDDLQSAIAHLAQAVFVAVQEFVLLVGHEASRLDGDQFVRIERSARTLTDGVDEARFGGLVRRQEIVVWQDVRMTEQLIEGEKMRQALEMARIVQMSTLPSAMPSVEGYEVACTFRPAELTDPAGLGGHYWLWHPIGIPNPLTP